MIIERSRGLKDFHLHTTFSDGLMKPRNLVLYAAARGVKQIAITDHENFRAIPAAMSEATICGMKYLTGIELNALFRLDGSKIRTLHILGYGFDYGEIEGNRPFNQYLDHILKIKENRCRVLCDETVRNPFRVTLPGGSDVNISVPFEELSRLVEEGYYDPGHFTLSLQLAASRMMPTINVARHDLVNILIRQKQETMNEVEAKNPGLKFHLNREYKAVYDANKLAASKEYIWLKDVIELIRGFGGVPIVAHPGEKGNGIVDDEIFELFDLGIGGIEVYSPKNKKDLVERYGALARERGLLVTGGTDFHGEEVSKGTIVGMYNEETPVEADPIETIIAAAQGRKE